MYVVQEMDMLLCYMYIAKLLLNFFSGFEN